MIIDLLQNKTAKEKATFKGQEIAKIGSVPRVNVKFSGADYDVEILSMNPIAGGVELFAKAWDLQGQIGFGDGTVDIERFRFINPPIMVPDGTFKTIINTDGREPSRVANFKEDPKQAILQSLAHTIKVSAQNNPRGKIIVGKVGNTTDTFSSAAGSVEPVDALKAASDLDAGVAWATIYNDTGFGTDGDNDSTTNAISPHLLAGASTDTWDRLYRSVFGFATGATIPSGDTISSATFSTVFLSTNYNDQTPAQSISIDRNVLQVASTFKNSDYNLARWDSVRQATDITITNVNHDSSTYTDFVLNATGIGNIAKGSGNSWLGQRLSGDFDNSPPTWSSARRWGVETYFVDQAGTSVDPKLVVVHAVPANTTNFLQFMGPQPQV